jgi:6-phosphogluconate dehydrogenase
MSGARHGACVMAGGERTTYAVVEPLLMHLAANDHAALYVGGPGSGHFAKLIDSARGSSSTSRRCSTTGSTAR